MKSIVFSETPWSDLSEERRALVIARFEQSIFDARDVISAENWNDCREALRVLVMASWPGETFGLGAPTVRVFDAEK
jgi:hypothetical protein